MQTIKDINTVTPEGKMLWAAIIVLTQSPDVRILGQNIRGSETEPDTMIKELNRLVEELGEDMPKPNKNHLPAAIHEIVESLKGDKSEGSYYYSWQANIAMAFKDRFDKEKIEGVDIHTIANEAAKNFLDNLIAVSK